MPQPTPSGMPPAGAGTQPGQPPFGSSPVQMPTPDRGSQAAALAQVAWAVRILEQALPALGAMSEPGKDIMKALSALSKHAEPGQFSAGTQQGMMQKMLMEGQQRGPQNAVLQALGQGGAQPNMPQASAPAGQPAPPQGATAGEP